MTVNTPSSTTASRLIRRDVNSSDRSVLARLSITFILIASAAGCATTKLVGVNQDTIDSNVSVIAFSVNGSEWTDEDLWVRPKTIVIRYGDESVPVPLDGSAAEPQRILLEVPAEEVAFDWYELDSGTGIFWKHYLSAISQSFQLTRGQVNYLGRIEINDVVFDTVDDEERRQPVQIKLDFANALIDDVAAWRQDYQLIQNQAPDKLIVGQQSGPEYQSVWADEFYRANPNPTRAPRSRKPTKPMRNPTSSNGSSK